MRDIMSIARTRGQTFPIKDYCDNGDLRRSIINAVPGAKAQLKSKAKEFKGRTEMETAKNVFDYLIRRTYVADGDEQVIKFPSAIMSGHSTDCKSFSLFTAGVFENLNIPYKFVWASYDPKQPIPAHAYVQTNSGIIVDAVWGKFNSEKPAAYKYYSPMNVKYMTGTNPGLGNCGCNGGTYQEPPSPAINGWLGDKAKQFTNWVGEKVDDVKDFVQDKAQDIKSKTAGIRAKAKQIGFSPGRVLFRAMVETNMDGMASKLAGMNQETLKFYWQKAGGDFGKLQSSINKGKNKAYRKFGLLNKLKSGKNISGIGSDDQPTLEETIILAVPAAGAALGTVIPGLGTAAGTTGGISLAGVLVAMIPIVKLLIDKTSGEAPSGDSFFNPGTTETVDIDEPNEVDFWNQTTVFGLKNKVAIPLGAILVGIGVYAYKKGAFGSTK